MARGDADTIERVLAYETWAVVGLTANPRRPAYGVARFLQQHGKRIVPVNPKAEAVHGEPGYATLADVPFPVDVVDVFRRSDEGRRRTSTRRSRPAPRRSGCSSTSSTRPRRTGPRRPGWT